MTDHDTPRHESPDAQRRKIEAMMQDPEMQQVAATARPRGPARSPHLEHADKQRMERRLATMAEAAERDPEIEQRIRIREKSNNMAARRPQDEPDPPRKTRKRRRHKDATGKPTTATPDLAKLYADLCDAATTGDAEAIIKAQSLWSWAVVNGSPCPPNRIVRQRELWTWVNKLPLSEEAERLLAATLATVEVYRQWVALPEESRSRPPLSLIVEDMQRRDPARVRMVSNKSTLIMPRTVAHVNSDADGYYLARFGRAVHRELGGQLLMSFATQGERGPTLPANVWTMGLGVQDRRNNVVPLALRIWVAAILHTPLHARHGSYPVQLDDLTLRCFLSWIYPGNRQPRPNEYWPRILAAKDVINRTELPFEYPTGSGNLWARPVVTLATPLTRPGLDDPWPVTTHLPPGDGTGPPINFARVQYWSVRDVAAFRALINLAYRWHIEGKRLMPARRGNHWLQRRDPKQYDVITDAIAEELCFPPETGAKRRDQRIADARDTLDKLVKEGDAECRDGRLLPPPRRSDGAGT